MLAGFWKQCGLLGPTAVWNMKAGVCSNVDPADIKICAFSKACKFSYHMLLAHHNQSECKAIRADQKNPKNPKEIFKKKGWQKERIPKGVFRNGWY